MNSGLRLTLALVPSIVIGCATAPSDPGGIHVVLRGGEEVRLEGTVLRLSFNQVVEDSRCPVNVQCVWAGNAKVLVGIAAGMGPTHALFLNSTIEPREVTWHGVQVALTKVEPQPLAGQPIAFESYRITLRLEF